MRAALARYRRLDASLRRLEGPSFVVESLGEVLYCTQRLEHRRFDLEDDALLPLELVAEHCACAWCSLLRARGPTLVRSCRFAHDPEAAALWDELRALGRLGWVLRVAGPGDFAGAWSHPWCFPWGAPWLGVSLWEDAVEDLRSLRPDLAAPGLPGFSRVRLPPCDPELTELRQRVQRWRQLLVQELVPRLLAKEKDAVQDHQVQA